MGKTTTTTSKAPSTDQIDQYLAGVAAKKDFMSASLNMGWQLAITILVPVFIGVKLDEHFHTTPSYTLAALILATGGAVFVISQNIKQVNLKQMTKPQASSKKKRKA